MGAMQGGPQSSAHRQGPTPRKGASRSSSSPSSSSSSSTMKPERVAKRKPAKPNVDVQNLVDGVASIEKHMVEKPRWDSSTFLQPDLFMSELKVKTGTPRSSPPAVSESPKSARSVRSIRASSENLRTEAVWEPPSPRLRTPSKRLEWNSKESGTPSLEASRSQSSGASQQSQSETFYDSLPTLESLESPQESPRWSQDELPKLELSFEGKPAPAPAHLRVRTGSTLPLPSEKSAQDPPELQKTSSEGSGRSKNAPTSSPALLKLQATSTLLGNGSNTRENMRSASSRSESSFAPVEGDARALKSFEGMPLVSHSEPLISHSEPLISHSEPLKPELEAAKVDVKPAGMLRRMLHWGASKLGKKSSAKVSSRSKNGSVKDIISQPTESKAGSLVKAEAGAKIEPERENVETDGAVAKEDPTESPRSSVSSVSTTYSDVSSKAHSHKHKTHATLETVKSKLWFQRVHQKLHGRNSINDESDASPAEVRGPTFHGYPADASSTEPVDKTMLTASARFNSEKAGVSKLMGKHHRNSTWDAGKLSNAIEDLFSPKQKLPKRDAQGLLTPPRPLTGDATEFQHRRRPTSLTTASELSSALPDHSPSPRKPRRTGDATDFQRRRRPASMTTTESLEPPDKSPRKPRLVNTRVAPDHQVSDSGSDTSTKSRRTTPRHGQTKQAAAAFPATTSSTAGTFLQTAALILATPGSKDEPNNQLFENSRKGSTPRSELAITTPPVSPTGNNSQRMNFKGFNAPELQLLMRVSAQADPPTSPIHPSPKGNISQQSQFGETLPSITTSPRLPAPSPPWLGIESSPSSPGVFAPSPGSVEMQSASRIAGAPGFQSIDSTSEPSPYARSEQLLREDVNTISLVKRPAAKNALPAQSPSDTATPASGSRRARSMVSDDRESSKSGSDLSILPAPSSPRLLQVGISFEQIVAGRDRSPPTENTLMKFFFKCREIEHLNKFLALQKKRFLESFSSGESSKRFHIILSEAGQGLSSLISTLCTAWLLENTMASASAKWHPIPVMNMCQKEMWEHRDAAWLFHVCGIDASAVLFLDEVSMAAETVIAGRVRRAVSGQDILQTKDEVASSCTIVSEKFRQEAPKLLQARYMKTLLLAGILVDTKNLSTGSSRDKQQATILLVGAGSLGRNGFYKHLVNIRDENYVTPFIKDIYGDSNALGADQMGPSGPGVEQPKPMSRPTSIISPVEPPKPTPPPPPPASRKSGPELATKLRSKSAPVTKSKAPLNKRGWFRNRLSAQ